MEEKIVVENAISGKKSNFGEAIADFFLENGVFTKEQHKEAVEISKKIED